MKILHFVIDEKFIEGAITLFESDERVENHYVVAQRDFRNFNYLKSEKIERIKRSDALMKMKGYDAVILHSLAALPIDLIRKIPQNIKVIWLAWGYDLYESYFSAIIPVDLYGEKTQSYLNGCKRDLSLKRKLGNAKRNLWHKAFLKSALNRIDFFSGVFPYEYDEVKKRHSYFKARPLDYYYGSKNFFIPETPEIDVKQGKKNVIIGNSGNSTNNHLDVLQALKQNGCCIDGQLIIPLSYGCDEDYANTVYDVANEIYPNKVNALRHFMPLNEYLDLISNCRVAIYAHKRQQASDNIFMQLMYGAKVYMSEDSLAFHYLKKIGLKIYSLEKDMVSFNENLADADVFENRRILSSLYSSSKLVNRIKKMNDAFMMTK